MLKLRLTTLAVAIAAVVLSVATSLISQPKGNHLPPEAYHMIIAANVLFASLIIGAAILFLVGLNGFKQQVRKAYMTICAGLVLLAIGYIQIPISTIFGLFEKPWFAYGAIDIAYVFAAIVFWFGLRKFATTLSLKSRWANPAFFVALLVAVGGVILLLVQIVLGSALLPKSTSLVLEGIMATAFIVIAVLAFQLKQAAGAAYNHALLWFFIALSVVVVSVSFPPIVDLLGIERGPFLSIPTTIAALLLIKAGYEFNKIGIYLSGGRQAKGAGAPASPVEVITYLASLASNPKDIDPILDSLRTLTARLKPGQELSEADQKLLVDIYNKLVDYLTTREPVREFTNESVSMVIRKRFVPSESSDTSFWSKVLAT